ncbi:MAG: phage terminase large subunit [Oscillospiraceae bacterium]|jgi:phage terminase large subunit|nr:phage terminase large subunit [Oscillospiraceae bacterium]
MEQIGKKRPGKEPYIFTLLRTEIPNPRQIEFFNAEAPHIAYGGARGGGKSWAMRRKFVMLAMRYPRLKILLLRRSIPELRENHIIPLRGELAGYASYRGDEQTFEFPNSARLKLGYCDNEGDLIQYQGQEFDVIGFEEATNFPEEWIVFICTCLRTTKGYFSPRSYYTMNPGGPGHEYMKRLFIDRRYRNGEEAENYIFIPARVYDNAVLMKADPKYIQRLEALPPQKRKAHLEGDWNIYEGQVFEEFKDDPARYDDRLYTHVISPFEIPAGWQIYRSFDFGYAKPFSVGWWAVDYDKRLYRILELYGCVHDEPDTGIKWSPDEIFGEIRRIEEEHRWLSGKKIQGVADPSIFDASRGESIAQMAEKYRIYFEPGENRRIPGWMQLHYRFNFDAGGIPMIYIFSSCKAFIRTIPLLQYDKNKPEDLDTRQEDHVADESRYICMAQIIGPKAVSGRAARIHDPLSEDTSSASGRYDWYISN